ncbi:MAG TPA: hypothetical protein VEG68_03145 [Terriglobales bacterium]|nr:hypothetical protein [Terriglobales bacterium]
MGPDRLYQESRPIAGSDVAKELLAIFTFACAAYNLVRLRNLTAPVPAV